MAVGYWLQPCWHLLHTTILLNHVQLSVKVSKFSGGTFILNLETTLKKIHLFLNLSLFYLILEMLHNCFHREADSSPPPIPSSYVGEDDLELQILLLYLLSARISGELLCLLVLCGVEY